MNNMSKPKFSIKEILALIKAYEIEKNLQVLQKYVEELMKDDAIDIEESDYEEILNECLESITNYIFHLPENSTDEQIVLRAFLFIFSVKKMNILEEENLDTNDLRIKLINNGCKLIKLCVENHYFVKIDYYTSYIIDTINKVKEFFRDNELVSNQIVNKKTEIMLYNIEKMVKQSKLTNAMEELNRQKDCIVMLSTYHEYYVGLCYNISLKCIQDENYDYALTVLLLAYDICKIANELSKNMKTALHFLVCVCWRYNPNKNWSSAINALELANKNEIDMFYITSKIKFAFISEAQHLVEEALNQATEWEHLKIKDICQIVQLLQKNELLILAADFIQAVKYKAFSMSDKFLLMKLEIQIYISGNDSKLFSLLDHAVEFIKKISIDDSSVMNFCKLLASHADMKFKEKMFNDSLTLYDYSAKICEFKGLDGLLLRHINTRICLCYIEVDNWKSARNKFEELRKCYNKDDPFYVYLALQVAFMGDDEKLAEDALRSCDGSDTNAGDILLSCCQKALMCGKKDILLKILEAILQKYHTSSRMMLVAKLCQCLIVLCTNYTDENRNDPEKYLLYMDKALHDLQQNPENEEASELSQWFSRAAWNLALTSDMEPRYIFEFFLRCCCFSEISVGHFNRLKNSLMLAAAAGLHVVRKMNPKEKRDERYSILRKIMTVIEKCKSLENGSNLTLLRLLYLYEFEARCHLNQWEDENVTEILRLPFMDVKTLEHIAAIVNKHSPHNYKIIMESLKAAVQKIPDGEEQETSKASKTYHSLVQVLFYVQEYFSSSVEEENLTLCRQLLILIEKKTFHHYPELEILWLMIKCWNWGIQKLTMNDPKRAYKWCTLAMTFLQKLESLKSLHEKKLNEMYAAYFSNFNNEKENPP